MQLIKDNIEPFLRLDNGGLDYLQCDLKRREDDELIKNNHKTEMVSTFEK
jgi:hypothetical protein